MNGLLLASVLPQAHQASGVGYSKTPKTFLHETGLQISLKGTIFIPKINWDQLQVCNGILSDHEEFKDLDQGKQNGKFLPGHLQSMQEVG